jgi:hypothetical protein
MLRGPQHVVKTLVRRSHPEIEPLQVVGDRNPSQPLASTPARPASSIVSGRSHRIARTPG